MTPHSHSVQPRLPRPGHPGEEGEGRERREMREGGERGKKGGGRGGGGREERGDRGGGEKEERDKKERWIEHNSGDNVMYVFTCIYIVHVKKCMYIHVHTMSCIFRIEYYSIYNI